MPRYYCACCDTYLTHDSPSVRKQHNAGYEHEANAAAFQAGPFNQHLQFPGTHPGLPILPTPVMAHGFPQGSGGPFAGIRPPIIPAPDMAGFLGAPNMMPQTGALPGSMHMQMAPLPRPPMFPRPMSGAPGVPVPNSTAPLATSQTNTPQTAGPSSGSPFSSGQPYKDNH